jgi:hypothetical protein
VASGQTQTCTMKTYSGVVPSKKSPTRSGYVSLSVTNDMYNKVMAPFLDKLKRAFWGSRHSLGLTPQQLNKWDTFEKFEATAADVFQVGQPRKDDATKTYDPSVMLNIDFCAKDGQPAPASNVVIVDTDGEFVDDWRLVKGGLDEVVIHFPAYVMPTQAKPSTKLDMKLVTMVTGPITALGQVLPATVKRKAADLTAPDHVEAAHAPAPPPPAIVNTPPDVKPAPEPPVSTNDASPPEAAVVQQAKRVKVA